MRNKFLLNSLFLSTPIILFGYNNTLAQDIDDAERHAIIHLETQQNDVLKTYIHTERQKEIINEMDNLSISPDKPGIVYNLEYYLGDDGQVQTTPITIDYIQDHHLASNKKIEIGTILERVKNRKLEDRVDSAGTWKVKIIGDSLNETRNVYYVVDKAYNP